MDVLTAWQKQVKHAQVSLLHKVSISLIMNNKGVISNVGFSQTINIAVFLLWHMGYAQNVLDYVTFERAITRLFFGREVFNISACLMNACLPKGS